MDCEYAFDFFDEMVFGSSLPFACLIVLCVVLLFCDDHQFIDVSRSERFSRSTGERWLRYVARLGWILIYDLSFRATAHIPLSFKFAFGLL